MKRRPDPQPTVKTNPGRPSEKGYRPDALCMCGHVYSDHNWPGIAHRLCKHTRCRCSPLGFRLQTPAQVAVAAVMDETFKEQPVVKYGPYVMVTREYLRDHGIEL